MEWLDVADETTDIEQWDVTIEKEIVELRLIPSLLRVTVDVILVEECNVDDWVRVSGANGVADMVRRFVDDLVRVRIWVRVSGGTGVGVLVEMTESDGERDGVPGWVSDVLQL